MNETDRTVCFAQLIRQRRLALRLKQAEIAAAMRVEPESVGNWETGRRRIELNRIPHLAFLLEVNPTDLCRMALHEWHPCFHDALFGRNAPDRPQCMEQPATTANHAPIRSLPLLPTAARSNEP
jgi:transcriptional regulator with XRE-family HTH domain